MRRLIVLIVAGLVTACGTTIDLQAHRGGRGLMPENTLPAFDNALRIGVTTLELDTAITRDGVVVIGHDPTLNPDIVRGPDGKWLAKKGPAIHSLTYAELRQYDIGRLNPDSVYGKRYPEQKAVDGTRYAKLIDLFALVRQSGNQRVRFNIETKLSPFERDVTVGPEAFVDALLAVIHAENMAHRVTLQSFDWRTLRIAQQKAPAIATVYLSAQQKFLDNINAGSREGSAWTAGLNAQDFGGSVAGMVKAAGGTIWSPYLGDIDEAKIKDAQQRGLKVVVWTVNEAKDIERMLDFKVDVIISDYPNRVREAMAKREMRLP
ncbi:MAG: glycerophosphodiester phosphodiesterase [Betaproteobacteria bacterium]